MGNFKKLELAVGAFVALGLAAFFMLAMKVSNIAELGEDQGYKITARFENIGGLKARAPVTLGASTPAARGRSRHHRSCGSMRMTSSSSRLMLEPKSPVTNSCRVCTYTPT